MHAPSAERNLPAITHELTGLLSGRTGALVEIGCGTGMHAAHLAQSLPDLIWIPSDPAPAHRTSTDAWRRHLQPENLRPALDLDALSDWWDDSSLGETPATAVFSANVIHIAPWPVTGGIITGASHLLGPDGLLIFYGPFAEGGRQTGEGNVRFDASLRLRNPEWGIRDLDDVERLASAAGFDSAEVRIMPANNRLVIFRRNSA